MVTASALIPKIGRLLPREAAERAINNALDGSAKLATSRLRRHVAGWNHQPRFITSTPAVWSREVATDDDVFLFQDAGTKGPYMIRARNKKVLRFQGRDGRWVSKREVKHPGLKARGYTKQVAATLQQHDMPMIFDRHFAKELA